MPDPAATACQSPLRFSSSVRTSASKDVFIVPTIAKNCYASKQHIAIWRRQHRWMDRPTISESVAVNLRHFITQAKLTEKGLAALSGVAQTTIGLYLNPERRKDTTKGVPPSPTLEKLQMLADSLGIEAWELIRPLTQAKRDLIKNIERVIAEGAPTPPAVIALAAPAKKTRTRKSPTSRRVTVQTARELTEISKKKKDQ